MMSVARVKLTGTKEDKTIRNANVPHALIISADRRARGTFWTVWVKTPVASLSKRRKTLKSPPDRATNVLFCVFHSAAFSSPYSARAHGSTQHNGYNYYGPHRCCEMTKTNISRCSKIIGVIIGFKNPFIAIRTFDGFLYAEKKK